MQILIEIPDNYKELLDEGYTSDNIIFALQDAVVEGIPLPKHHGDLKDIGNMELLNVQVHDDYSKGWHNAIEYCVRQLRERPTIIPATKEKSCATCGQPRDYTGQCILFKEGKCVDIHEKWKPTTKEGD